MDLETVFFNNRDEVLAVFDNVENWVKFWDDEADNWSWVQTWEA